ncbi:MAG: DUF420 domain-containing protein [Planctomycetota bacterium]
MTRPELHALLNSIAALLLTFGWMAIKGRGPWSGSGKSEGAHKTCMLVAVAVSAAFLVSYLQYHARVGSVSFTGTGWSRALYFAVLIPHTLLAAVQVPLILVTLTLALRKRFERHRRWARWTLPIWLFVSVTGVAVYLMLYVIWPG